MTSPDLSHDTLRTSAPAKTHATCDSQNPGKRETLTPVASDVLDPVKSDAPSPNVRPTGVQGGGSLRQAIQELVAGVECLCGDTGGNERSDAKRHLDEAKRLLSTPTHESVRRGAAEARSSTAGSPAARDASASGDIQQDLQRAMR